MPKTYVTKTYLPDKQDYIHLLDEVWQTHSVTNNARYSKQLEYRLKKYLEIPEIQYVSNGTIALQLAIKSLKLEGEILTTPFTYVATANSILWQRCTPVFVDIDPETFNIDPEKLEANRTDQTSAVLAVHVYGYPAPVEALETYTENHDLALLYDAAHAFGCKYKDRSLVSYGDMATLSFHATKVFHTIEGGAVITHSKERARDVKLSATHGHEYDDYLQVGINAKNSEFHAGIGLLNLEDFDKIRLGRKRVHEHYVAHLENSGLYILRPSLFDRFEYNYAYFPVLFPNVSSLIRSIKALNEAQIYPRRYFYPALNTLDYLNRSHCPVAEDIAPRMLCLPLYHDLPLKQVSRIAAIVNENL